MSVLSEVSCIRVICMVLPMFPLPAGSRHTPLDIHLLTRSIVLGLGNALARLLFKLVKFLCSLMVYGHDAVQPLPLPLHITRRFTHTLVISHCSYGQSSGIDRSGIARQHIHVCPVRLQQRLHLPCCLSQGKLRSPHSHTMWWCQAGSRYGRAAVGGAYTTWRGQGRAWSGWLGILGGTSS